MKKIILASDSPRRKEILQNFGFDFNIIKSDYVEMNEWNENVILNSGTNKAKGQKSNKEDISENLNNENVINSLIKKNCYCKAKSVTEKIASQAIVIGADTVVTLDSVCLLKPHDFHEAFLFLKKLSGRVHKVKTAICLISNEKEMTKIFETKVSFRNLNDDEIRNYIEKFKPYDKAGAYGIQDFLTYEQSKCPPVESFINKIEGSYHNVMGICPFELKEMLKEFG